MKTTTLTLLFFALPVAAKPPEAHSILVTVRGSLIASGKPVVAAQFYLTPAQGHTAVELDRGGRFEVKAVASRSYSVDIHAAGYAPVRKTIDLDPKGAADLGTVQLHPLTTARLSVVVGPRDSLKGIASQRIEVRHGSCASVRAQDESGCRIEFCATQDGPQLQIASFSNAGQLRSAGKISIEDALGPLPKGTFVTGHGQAIALNPGETLISELADPYCAAVLHVEE